MSAPFEPNSITIIKMKGTEASFSSASFHPKHSSAYHTDAPEDAPPRSYWNLKCPKANIIFYRWQSISRRAQGVCISLTSPVEVSYLSSSDSRNPAGRFLCCRFTSRGILNHFGIWQSHINSWEYETIPPSSSVHLCVDPLAEVDRGGNQSL